MKFSALLVAVLLAGAASLPATAHAVNYPNLMFEKIRAEVYGWKPSAHTATLDGKALASGVSAIRNGIAITVPADSEGFALQLR